MAQQIKVSFGEGVRLVRLQNKLTQEECAKFFGITPKTFIAIEKRKDNHFQAAFFNYFVLVIEKGALKK